MSQAADNSRCHAPVITKKVARHDSCEGSHCAVIYDRLGTLLQVVCVVVSATPQNFAWA